MKNLAFAVVLMMGISTGFAADASSPVGEPALEKSTLRSLGSYWIIKGDDNKNAAVNLEYRKAGESAWHKGPPLFRVEKGAHIPKENESLLKVPDDAWLFAGSVVLLEPSTKYEMKLTLADPDGGAATKTLSAATIGEPIAPTGGPVYHVIPGEGGGSGTQADPYKGLAIADKRSKPGDTFLLHAGTYKQPPALRKSGEPGKPIIWRGAGDGEAIIDGLGNSVAVECRGQNHRWFEDLAITHAKYAIVSHEATGIVLRRCKITGVEFGLAATKNPKDTINDYFITDNVMEGPSTWPRAKGIEDARGVQLTGSGHVVAYNRIVNFGDAVDTMPSNRVESIDIHNNDCDILTDDGIETDYAHRNVRVFHNRITNAYQGISIQPVYGGPIYVFRNVLVNVVVEPFKMHNGPSAALFYHNTVVKTGIPSLVYTAKPNHNIVSRNNIYVGTGGRAAFDFDSPMEDCDFDYDGVSAGEYGNFLRWNKGKYATLEDAKKNAPVYKNAVLLDNKTLFASGLMPPADANKAVDPKEADTRLAASSKAVDAGQKLPGFNDDAAGAAPDLGAYEFGKEMPHYGPRKSK